MSWCGGGESSGVPGVTGRISAIDAVVADPNVVYVGAAHGGLWKTVNGGQSWRAVFDDQPVSAIGSVAVDQAYPDIVGVGLGERQSPGGGHQLSRSKITAPVPIPVSTNESWQSATCAVDVPRVCRTPSSSWFMPCM